MRCNSSDIFRLFFRELEERDIPYVILHSYEHFPEHVTSDVDYAVLTKDLSKLAGIQAALAERHGWRLAQAIEAHIYSLYTVLIDPEEPRAFLQLDACGHYVERNCFFVSDTGLLEHRRRFGGFYVPAPAAEFCYLLAKAVGKFQPLAPRLPHLRALWEQDPAKTEEQFRNLCGPIQGPLEEWFAKPPAAWELLGPVILRRNRFGWPDRAREAFRVWKRVRQPEGLHLAVLGPDGSGKSTLLERIAPLIERPFFRHRLVFHFRPNIFEPDKNDTPVTYPHALPPRNQIAGAAKLLYYFADHLAGYFIKVLPAKVRNELIIFCRSFDDLLIDPHRYRLAGTSWLARVLRRPTARPS